MWALLFFFLFGEDFWSEDKVGNGNCNTFARTQICFDYFLFLHDAITKKRDGHLSSFLLFPLFFLNSFSACPFLFVIFCAHKSKVVAILQRKDTHLFIPPVPRLGVPNSFCGY